MERPVQARATEGPNGINHTLPNGTCWNGPAESRAAGVPVGFVPIPSTQLTQATPRRGRGAERRDGRHAVKTRSMSCSLFSRAVRTPWVPPHQRTTAPRPSWCVDPDWRGGSHTPPTPPLVHSHNALLDRRLHSGLPIQHRSARRQPVPWARPTSVRTPQPEGPWRADMSGTGSSQHCICF